MKIAAIQLSVVENDPEATVEKAEKAIRSCPDADLVMLPEIWQTGFMNFDRYEADAQPLEGPLLSRLKNLAKELKIMLHTGSFVEKGTRFIIPVRWCRRMETYWVFTGKSICSDFNPGKHRS